MDDILYDQLNKIINECTCINIFYTKHICADDCPLMCIAKFNYIIRHVLPCNHNDDYHNNLCDKIHKEIIKYEKNNQNV